MVGPVLRTGRLRIAVRISACAMAGSESRPYRPDCSHARPAAAAPTVAAHVEFIARARATATKQVPRLDGAADGDVDKQHRRSARCCRRPVAHARPAPPRRGPCTSSATHRASRVARQPEREQRDARFGAHRRDVAQVDVQRAVPDVGGRAERAREMHAVDLHVGRQHVHVVAPRHDHRGIVADAEQDVGRRRARRRRWRSSG